MSTKTYHHHHRSVPADELQSVSKNCEQMSNNKRDCVVAKLPATHQLQHICWMHAPLRPTRQSTSQSLAAHQHRPTSTLPSSHSNFLPSCCLGECPRRRKRTHNHAHPRHATENGLYIANGHRQRYIFARHACLGEAMRWTRTWSNSQKATEQFYLNHKHSSKFMHLIRGLFRNWK